jgi:hypothetical protein
MTHGNAGRPKTEEHKARISASLKERHARLAADVDELRRGIVSLRTRAELGRVTGADATDELFPLLLKAMRVLEASTTITNETLQQEVYRLRGELSERAGQIESMDVVDLLRAKSIGLVKASVADEEFARRRADGSSTIRAPLFHGGAAIGGFLECGHHACNRVVDVSNGSFCDEHRLEAPREYVTPNFQIINLDALMEDARKRLEKGEELVDRARADIERLEEQIRRFDEDKAKQDA